MIIHSVSWYFTEAFSSIFEIIIILTFLDGFLEKKEISRIKQITVLVVAFLQLVLVCSFLYNIPNALIVNFLLVSVLISKTFFKGKLDTQLFTCVLLLAILVVTELASVSVLILSLDLEAEIFRSDPLFRLFAVTIKNILSFVAVKVVCMYKKSYVSETGRKYFFLLLAIPVISIVVAMIILDLVVRYRVTETFYVLIAYICLMYVNAIVFSIYELILDQLEKNYNYRLIEKQLELQLNHYNKLAENHGRFP